MSLTNRFHDLKIATKIGLGFSAILAVTAGTAYFGASGLATLDGAIRTISQRVAVADIAQSTQKEFVDLRRQVREYALTGDDQYLGRIEKERKEVVAFSEKALVEIKNPERHEMAVKIHETLQNYIKSIEALIAKRHKISELTSSDLVAASKKLASTTAALSEMSLRLRDMPAIAASMNVAEQVMLSRINVNEHLGREDEGSKAAAYAAFEAAAAKISEMKKLVSAPESAPLFDASTAAIETYKATFTTLVDLNNDLDTYINVTMRGMANAIEEGADKLADSAQSEEKRVEEETFAQSARTQSLMLWFSAAGIALGALMAWLIGTGISRPIRAIADVLRELAQGHLTIDVPYALRKDEVGENARSAQFFKEQLVDAERLRQEQARQQAQREERQRVVESAVRKFENQIEQIVGSVTEASGQLEKAAVQLTSTAGNTQKLSSAVAAASEQTSANVQGVAAASEELAATVSEIGRQVQESSQIAGRAVEQAASTNAQVTKLSEVANRIGDVVDLINNIAGQTNLLALNATIEAARAGEAGKGFAVVAQEVKALATQTGKATNEISAQISSMQAATEEAVGAIHEISETISRINEIAAAIAAAVEEQDATTKEISRNVMEAAKGTSEVASNVTDVNHGATETGAASQQVLSSAKQLAGESGTLRREVSVFLDAVRAA